MRMKNNLFTAKTEYESRLKISPEKTLTKITVYDESGNKISSRTIEKEISKGMFAEASYKEASENRRFEIQMYWHRAAYFWAFIISIYTAFFFISGNDENAIPHSALIKLGLAFLGFLFCSGFYLVNVGSKQWIKNWEYHEGLLEDEFAGSLYKTYLYNRDESFSVSKINECLCLALSFASGAFFVLHLVDCIEKWFEVCPAFKFAIFAASITFVAIFLKYAKSHLMGNDKDEEDLNFKKVEYE